MPRRKGTALPPWHLWGNTISVVAPGTNATAQLAKVAYKRPESWSFFFFANQDAQASIPIITVQFGLILGVGRASMTIPVFCELFTSFGTPSWTTTVPSVGVVDPITNLATSQLIDRIVAQDIQCQATVLSPMTGGAVTVGAMFAPIAHVRPDWFEQDFLGGETEGT